MNVFEKQLIEAFLSPDDAKYNRAIQIMFFGDNHIARICMKVVNIMFDGSKYSEAKAKPSLTLYRTFVSLFALALRQKPDKLREVENLASWMFKVAKNFCNQYRNQINYLLGFDPYGGEVPFDQGYDIDDGEEEEPEETVEKEDDAEDPPSDDDLIADVLIDIPDEKDELNDLNRHDIAIRRLNYYLDNLLSSGKDNARYYVNLIIDNHIIGKTKKEMAAAYGRTPAGIDKDLQNARNALVAVNIEAIQKKGKTLFSLYGTMLDTKKYQVLDDFFNDRPVSPNKAAEAWRALVAVSRRDERDRDKTAEKEDHKLIKQEKKIKKFGL